MQITVNHPPFVGTVTLPDFLTLPQVLLFEDANGRVREIRAEKSDVSVSRIDAENIPLILSVVTSWQVAGVPEKPEINTLPVTPRLASAQMLAQIIREITRMYRGETDIPNG